MDDKQPVDTLRISQGERQRLLRRLEEHVAAPGACRRGQARYPCEFRADPVIRIRQYGGQEITYLSLGLDLSASGMGFIHGCFLYPTTPVRVTLTALDGEKISVDGQVVHCEHVEGRFHEVGVRFTNPIDTHLFVTVPGEEAPADEPGEQSEALKSVLGLVEAVNGLKQLVARSAQKDKINQSLEQVCDLFTQARMLITTGHSPDCSSG